MFPPPEREVMKAKFIQDYQDHKTGDEIDVDHDTAQVLAALEVAIVSGDPVQEKPKAKVSPVKIVVKKKKK